MKRLFLMAFAATTVLLGSSAFAQTIGPAPGCEVGVACQAKSLALNGTVIGSNALSSTGFSVNSSGVTSVLDIFVGDLAQANASGAFAWAGRTAMTSAADGTITDKNTGGTRAFTLDFSGIPVPTGTGTPTITAGSTDAAGEVASGASATSVVITFSSAKTNAPFCLVTPQTQLLAFAYTISTTAITITQTATSGEKIDYFCVQH